MLTSSSRGVNITIPINEIENDVDGPPGSHPLLLSNCLLDLGIPSSLSLTFDYIVIGMFLLCCKRATFRCDPLKRGWFVIFPSPILASLFTSAVLAIPSAWMFDRNPKSQFVNQKGELHDPHFIFSRPPWGSPPRPWCPSVCTRPPWSPCSPSRCSPPSSRSWLCGL